MRQHLTAIDRADERFRGNAEAYHADLDRLHESMQFVISSVPDCK